MPIQTLGTAVTTFTAQNIGVQNLKRVNSGIRSALFLGAIFSLAGLIILPAAPFLMHLFTDNPTAIASGVAFLHRLIPFYVLLAANSILSSALQGGGNIYVPALSSVLSLWFACVPGAYIFSYFFGGNNLFFCYAISWAVNLAVLAPYFISGRWQKKAINTVQCVLVESDNLAA